MHCIGKPGKWTREFCQMKSGLLSRWSSYRGQRIHILGKTCHKFCVYFQGGPLTRFYCNVIEIKTEKHKNELYDLIKSYSHSSTLFYISPVWFHKTFTKKIEIHSIRRNLRDYGFK
jgi:hypothetical protein